MRLWAKVGASSLFAAALAVSLSTDMFAQTSQTKGVPSEQEAAQAAPTPPRTWKVSCSSKQAGLDCRALQTLFLKNTGQPVLTAAVHVPPDTKKPTLLFSLPLGFYIPAGVSLQFGKDAAKSLPVQTCDRGGCLVQYAISAAEISAMQQGADLSVTLQDMKKKPITFVVPVAGFSEAYAKVK